MQRGAGVEDGVDSAIEIFEHMGGSRGAGAAEGVGAGSGDRQARSPDQFEGYRVRRHADPDQTSGAEDGGREVKCVPRLGGMEALGIESQAQGLHRDIFAAGRATLPARLYSQIMVAVETEIKFRVGNLAELDRRLQEAGF